MTKIKFNKIAFLGLGLIGSSLARVVRQQGLAGELSVYVRRQATRDEIQKLGLVDDICDSPAAAVKGADLVIFATPLGAYEKLTLDIKDHLQDGAIISDVGSTKASIMKLWQKLMPDHVHIIPGHPVAGTENSGPESGFAELFKDRYTILTPPKDGDKTALDKVKQLWQATGSMVEIMDAAHHDRVLAITSHLPHVIAYTIVRTAADLETHLHEENVDQSQLIDRAEVLKYSAGGFRDFTRIAGSDPTMWRDIFLNNSEAVLEMLGRFSEDLLLLQRAIRMGDGDYLEDWFTKTRDIRRGIIAMKQAGTFAPIEPDTKVKD